MRPIQILYNTIICVLPTKDMNMFVSITALALSLSPRIVILLNIFWSSELLNSFLVSGCTYLLVIFKMSSSQRQACERLPLNGAAPFLWKMSE
jgi:hypothetical protein